VGVAALQQPRGQQRGTEQGPQLLLHLLDGGDGDRHAVPEIGIGMVPQLALCPW
jgi:hypothetical protein